jgi:hypothetical protein
VRSAQQLCRYYLVRLRVTTHLGIATVEQLPVPHPGTDSPAFQTIVSLATVLARAGGDSRTAARLQAEVARLYGLSPDEFRLVLGSFPLVAQEARDLALGLFAPRP